MLQGQRTLIETKDYMRTKGFIMALVLAMLPIDEVFANGVRFLVVKAKDGTKTTFALTDEPKVSCKSGKLTIVSKGSSFALSLAEVASYAFTEESTGIGEILKDGNVKLENGCVVFSGLSAGSMVSAYMKDGRLVRECKANANGLAVVDMTGLPKGVVIIHSNKTDIKIINR